jgi:hypothetical protein
MDLRGQSPANAIFPCYFRGVMERRRPHSRAACRATLAAAVVSCLVGCAGHSDTPPAPSSSINEQLDTTCLPMDAAAFAPACDKPGPSFANDIAPLLDRACNNCHTQGSGLWPLVGYQDVRDWAYSILLDVEGCRMPPADGGTPDLSTADREMLLAWIGCGANNN